MTKCNEVMTKDPVCGLPNDSVAKAAELMKSENIGSIPVIESATRWTDKPARRFLKFGKVGQKIKPVIL